MEVFRHHIYEYSKGLRNLVLHTIPSCHEEEITSCLDQKKISYVVYRVSPKKINVFFGNSMCVEIINRIGKSNLCDYTEEEDFILGTMLGYDRIQQCERYLSFRSVKPCLVG